jgi:choline-sulfatase
LKMPIPPVPSVCPPGSASFPGSIPNIVGVKDGFLWLRIIPPIPGSWLKEGTILPDSVRCIWSDPISSQGFHERPYGDLNRKYGRAGSLTGEFHDRENCEVPLKWSDEKEVRRAGVGDYPDRGDRLAVEALGNHLDSRTTGLWYDRHNRETPRLVYMGFVNPHYPYLTTEENLRYYMPRVNLPENREPFEHPFLGRSPWLPEGTDKDRPMGERELLRGRATYYGKIDSLDRRIGQTLDLLRESGEDLNSWIIIYTSDHGDMIGEHGIWEKQKFFEESVRVPLIIRWPEGLGKGRRIKENVSLCDLYATIAELAGIDLSQEERERLDSRSLVPLMKGQTSSWNNIVYSFFLQQGYRNIMIKQGNLKYQAYSREEIGEMPEVLFDLKKDRKERENLIDREEYTSVLEELRALSLEYK